MAHRLRCGELSMYRALSNFVEFLARIAALAGGALLLGIVALTFVSILGRAMVPCDIGL